MPERELKQLRRKRGSIRTQVTTTIGRVDALTPAAANYAVEVHTLTARMKRLKVEVHAYDQQIEEHMLTLVNGEEDEVNQAALDAEIDEALGIQESIGDKLDTLSVLSDGIRTQPKAETPPIALNNSGLLDGSIAVTPQPPPPQTRLPFTDVPKFDGDVLKFQSWWDLYKATVHEQPFPAVSKMAFLRQHVVGEALDTIAHFQTTADSYNDAVELLKERFGQPQEVRFAHLNRLLHLPPAVESNELRNTVNELESRRRCLNNLGFKDIDEMYCCVFLSKLPPDVHAQVSRRKPKGDWKLTELIDILSSELQAANSYKVTTTDVSETLPRQQPGRSKGQVFTAGSLITDSRQTGSKPNRMSKAKFDPKRCSFCNTVGLHYSDSCPKVPTVAARRKLLVGKCWRCLGDGHQTKDCQKQRPCYYCRDTSHHRSLCTSAAANRLQTHSDSVIVAGEQHSLITMATSVMPLATVQARRSTQGDKQVSGVNVEETKLCLDSASARSYVTEQHAKKLKLAPHTSELLTYSSFAANKPVVRKVPIADLELQTADGTWMRTTVTIIPTITTPVTKFPLNPERYQLLKDSRLQLAEPQSASVEQVTLDLLIGLDAYFHIVKGRQRQLAPGLVLLDTRFGWVAAGALPGGENFRVSSLFCHSLTDAMLVSTTAPNTDPLMQSVERFWSIDSIGVIEDGQVSDDDAAITLFKDTVGVCETGRYVVTLPWRSAHPDLPSNYGLAAGRLKTLLNQLKPKPDLLQQYNDVFQQQLALGIIETAPSNSDATVHYLPHHAVQKGEGSSRKLRVVFDAAAKSSKDSPSLNDCLLRGPVMLRDLAGILLRFRRNRIGISADIEKAFLQVGLKEESDRDVCRFLWPKDVFADNPMAELQTFRFRRVPFGVVSSPFLLAATVEHHLRQSESPSAPHLLHNIYVDNLLSGTDTVEEAVKLQRDTKGLFNEAKMNLRDWMSNSSEFMQQIPNTDQHSQTNTKVLGLHWNLQQDTLHLAPLQPDQKPPTKRSVLQQLSKVFDPLGLVCPVTIMPKMLVQKLWTSDLGWDEPLPPAEAEQWAVHQENLRQLSSLAVPRHIGLEPGQTAELHAFADASKGAYAVCLYLRLLDDKGSPTHCRLIMAKARVAPLKELTIPRLELLAATTAARLSQFAAKELDVKIQRTVLWSDSKCVLYWLGCQRLQGVFVENRLCQIRKAGFQEYRYVNTSENPADLPSRGCTSDEMLQSSLWWEGPYWMKRSEDEWPKSLSFAAPPDGAKEEQRKGEPATPLPSLIAPPADIPTPFDLDVAAFPTLDKLLTRTAWCMRAAKRFRKLAYRHNGAPDVISPAELEDARRQWELWVQRSAVPQLLQRSDLTKLKGKQWEANLGLYKDVESGLIRCRGRLQNSLLSEASKHPILLPKGNCYTALVIQDCHYRILHSGVKHTLAELRKRYWITAGRQEVQRIIHRCRLCRRWEGGPFRAPPPPPLPRFRVEECQPFATTGLDYMGPLYCNNGGGSENEAQKTWVCLFTCAVTRAVHLEAVPSLNTADFIDCYRRFCACRGTPTRLVSDNAKQFRLAASAIERAWSKLQNDSSVQQFAAKRGTTWEFNTELAPWMGGFFERLIGSVKRSLKKTLNKALLTFPQLQTVLKEIEAMLNSRPITHLGPEPDDDYLTPAHFLGNAPSGYCIPSSQNDREDADYREADAAPNSREGLLAKWNRAQHLLNGFWKSWTNDYLLSLRERNDGCPRPPHGSSITPPAVGQTVLLKDQNQPRGHWRLGVITSLLRGADGHTRAAQVRTKKGKILRRPLKLLVPLESPDSASGDTGDNKAQAADTHGRPGRQAKEAAAIKIGSWAAENLI